MCELVPAHARQSYGEDHGKEHAMILPTKAMEGTHIWFKFGVFFVRCIKWSWSLEKL